jgi:hypothetical protein
MSDLDTFVRERTAERCCAMVCRALVAVVMCMTGSCTISNVFGPAPAAEPTEQPRCAFNPEPGFSDYRCHAAAAYCGRHHEPEAPSSVEQKGGGE